MFKLVILMVFVRVKNSVQSLENGGQTLSNWVDCAEPQSGIN